MSDPNEFPLKPKDKDFFVDNQHRANAKFSDSSKTNNSVQFTGDLVG